LDPDDLRGAKRKEDELRVDDNRSMTRLPNGRWVFDAVASTAVARIPPVVGCGAASVRKGIRTRKSQKKVTSLDMERISKCNALLEASGMTPAEWRRTSQSRYEAHVGRRRFFVEFGNGGVVRQHGEVDKPTPRMDEWTLENSVPPLGALKERIPEE
jgi:hypothetical protein